MAETIGRLTGGVTRDFGGRIATLLDCLDDALAARDDETRVALMHEARRKAAQQMENTL